MYRRTTTIVTAAVVCLVVAGGAAPEPPYSIAWTRQLGTASNDESRGVAVDGLGNVFISGYTKGDLHGTNAGGYDAFVSKYDSSGNIQWTRQLGTARDDYSHGVAADGVGNVFISGETWGHLDGHAGSADAFVSKYDTAGNIQWTRQLGTASDDGSSGVVADGLGNVFISGWTGGDLDGTNAGDYDAFVSKYDTSGNIQWTRQLGTSDLDYSMGVAADPLGNVFISGYTLGDLDGSNAGGSDAFVVKYDSSGNYQWTRQLGTADRDSSSGVAADGLGNVFISGLTRGDLDGTIGGAYDAFVSKYDTSGTIQWTRQLGASDVDASKDVAADPLGNVFISGNTDGDLDGTNAGWYDVFVSKYDNSGNYQWTRQLGTPGYDASYGVAADGLGNVLYQRVHPGRPRRDQRGRLGRLCGEARPRALHPRPVGHGRGCPSRLRLAKTPPPLGDDCPLPKTGRCRAATV